jgi:integrase
MSATLEIVPQFTDDTDHQERDTYPEADSPGGWRHESARWLATLNPGRTQTEYKKAVSYFFSVPGVPARISELTFDLLLAYRGALARRATAHQEVAPTSRAVRNAPPMPLLQGEHVAGSGARPLSPATVNIRLTALRQFLCHCRIFGSGLGMDGDHVRMALKRLKTDRRRPYQILAEPEWRQFLEAAKMPDPPKIPPQQTRPRGVWGRTREEYLEAERPRQAQIAEAQAAAADPGELVRTTRGLTGQQTARRDHALLALFLATGLRAIELSSLDVGDLSREWRAGAEEWWLILPDSKTKGQSGGRTLPLAPELAQILRDYLEVTGRQWERPEDRETPLFLSGASGSIRSRLSATQRQTDEGAVPPRLALRRLSPGQIRLIVDRVETQWQAHYLGAGRRGGRRSGDVRRISPHALRHSTAVALLEGNQATGRPPASVEHVRGWLGHLDIRTTQGYLAHLDARRHRRPFTLSPVSSGQGDDAEDV